MARDGRKFHEIGELNAGGRRMDNLVIKRERKNFRRKEKVAEKRRTLEQEGEG